MRPAFMQNKRGKQLKWRFGAFLSPQDDPRRGPTLPRQHGQERHRTEAVKAYVVLVPGAEVDEESLIDYSMEYLARYKCPTKVMFVDQLPRNAGGKLIRRELEGTIIGG